MYQKRKRAVYSEDEEKEIFAFSKRVLRSPNYREKERIKEKEKEKKPNMAAEQLLQVVLEIKNIQLRLDKKDDFLCEMMKEMNELKEDMKKKDESISQLMEEIKNLRKDNKKFEEN